MNLGYNSKIEHFYSSRNNVRWQNKKIEKNLTLYDKQQQQQHSFFSQASWGRLEMKPERNKFKVQAH